MHILSVNQSASINRQVERERERERCVLLNFIIFFNSENSSTYFSFVYTFAKKSDRRDVLHYKRHLRRWRASEIILFLIF